MELRLPNVAEAPYKNILRTTKKRYSNVSSNIIGTVRKHFDNIVIMLDLHLLNVAENTLETIF